MSKDRFIKCKHYVCEGECNRDREGTFYNYCQHCDLYDPVKGSTPAKKNLKRHKLNSIREHEDKSLERNF